MDPRNEMNNLRVLNDYLNQTLDVLSLVQMQAAEARYAVESYNAPDPILTGDAAFLGDNARQGWNYLLGTTSRTGRGGA